MKIPGLCWWQEGWAGTGWGGAGHRNAGEKRAGECPEGGGEVQGMKGWWAKPGSSRPDCSSDPGGWWGSHGADPGRGGGRTDSPVGQRRNHQPGASSQPAEEDGRPG